MTIPFGFIRLLQGRKCPVCLNRVWFWQRVQMSLGQKLHHACFWSRYFYGGGR